MSRVVTNAGYLAAQRRRCSLANTSLSTNVVDLVAVHRHPLRVAAQLAVGGRADGSAAGTTVCAALLQGQQLLGTEGLVVDLGRGLDEVLEVGSEEEVSQVHEFAVSLILDVDHTPSVLAATDLLAVDNDRLLGSDDGEGDEVLYQLATVYLARVSLEQDIPSSGCSGRAPHRQTRRCHRGTS